MTRAGMRNIARVMVWVMFVTFCFGDLLQAHDRRPAELRPTAPTLTTARTGSLKAEQLARIADLRRQSIEAKAAAHGSNNDRLERRLDRILLLLDIAQATSSAERHQLISKLPVQIVETADGKDFVADGKVRFHMPKPRPHATSSRISDEPRKPFEQPDGGVTVPAVDLPIPDDCYEGEEIVECATTQDGEDGMALAASLDADIAQAQADNDDADQYCNDYGCAPLDVLATGGPNVGDADSSLGCAAEAAGAVIDIAAAVGARWALYSMASEIAAGVAVSTGGLALAVFGAVASVAGAVFAGYAYYRCSRRIASPDAEMNFWRFEPAY